MNTDSLFSIQWQIAEGKWEQARLARQKNPPGSDYDETLTPLYDLLYGYIQFAYNGVNLFPGGDVSNQNTKVSVLDLAVELARTAYARQFIEAPDGAVANLVELEFRVEINFEKRAGDVIITTNQSDTPALVVPQKTFFSGVTHFLTTFTQEIKKQSPDLLDWECVAELREH